MSRVEGENGSGCQKGDGEVRLESSDVENSERAVQCCDLVLAQEEGTAAETRPVGGPEVVQARNCRNKSIITSYSY